MDQLIAQLITDLVKLIIVAVGGYLVAWLRSKLSQDQIRKAMQIAGIAVKAAEAIGAAQGLDGKAKMQQALNTARTVAAKYGIRFTDEEWQALLEQAVHELKTLGDELHAVPKVS